MCASHRKLLFTWCGQLVKKTNRCGFYYATDEIFHSPSCYVSRSTLQRFRLFAALYHWFILILRFSEVERLPPFYYLTNIVYLLCAVYYTLAMATSSNSITELPLYNRVTSQVFRMDRMCYEERKENIRLVLALQWLLHSVILNLNILVSILYFLLIYNPQTDRLGLTNISRHVLNTIFILIEFSFNSMPVKFIHVIWGLVLAFLYAMFTLIFWVVTPPPENYIYRVIDWNKPGKTASLIAMLCIAAIGLKALLVAIGKWKIYCMNVKMKQSYLRDSAFQI